MSGVIFAETVRRNFRTMLYWTAAFVFMSVVSIAFVQDSKTLQQMGQLLKTLPPFVLAMVGTTDVEFITTPIGFLSARLFSIAMLGFCAYAVVSGMNVSANDEDRGSLDVLLSMPVTRTRLILEKLAAYVVLLIVMALLTFAATWIMILVTPAFKDADFGRMLAAFLNLLPGSFLVLGVTTFLGTVLRRRGTALGLASLFVAASYFIDLIGRSAESTNALRAISFYSYYDGAEVVRNGLAWGSVIGMVVIAGVFMAATVWLFQCREINV